MIIGEMSESAMPRGPAGVRLHRIQTEENGIRFVPDGTTVVAWNPSFASIPAGTLVMVEQLRPRWWQFWRRRGYQIRWAEA